MILAVLKLLTQMSLWLVATREDLGMRISPHRLRCLVAVVLLLVPMHQDVANTIGNTLLVDAGSGKLRTMIITTRLEAGVLQTEIVTSDSEIILPEMLGGKEWQTASTILEVRPILFFSCTSLSE
jgi:hypothetical protein